VFPFANPLMLVAGGYTRPASYVTSGKRNGAAESSTLNLAGAAVGDYIVFAAVSSTATISGGAGEWSVSSSPIRLLAKKLAAADLVSGALNCGAYPWTFSVYRKPQTHQQKASGTLSNTDLALTGFVKDSRSAGVIGVVKTAGPATALTTPAGFTVRQTALDGSGFSFDIIAIYDLLSPGIYTDNASVTFAPGASKTISGVLLELLNSGPGAGAGPGGPFGSTDFSEDGNSLFPLLF
jgi:hypothetical protein